MADKESMEKVGSIVRVSKDNENNSDAVCGGSMNNIHLLANHSQYTHIPVSR